MSHSYSRLHSVLYLMALKTFCVSLLSRIWGCSVKAFPADCDVSSSCVYVPVLLYITVTVLLYCLLRSCTVQRYGLMCLFFSLQLQTLLMCRSKTTWQQTLMSVNLMRTGQSRPVPNKMMAQGLLIWDLIFQTEETDERDHGVGESVR